MKRYLGIDLGGTNIAAGLVTEDGDLLYKASVPTRSQMGHKQVIADMIALCRQVMAESGASPDGIASIGIGAPGHIDRARGVVVFAGNLGFAQVPVCGPISQALGLPTYIENDANCAALAESFVGAARGAKDSITVTLGTGIGGGILIGGKINTGAYGGGGEIGHIIICMDGELCTCGCRGCWEAYASATALIRQAKAAAAQSPQSLLVKNAAGDLASITGKAVFDAAEQGDETARAVITAYLRYVAVGLANLIDTLEPETIALGGGICAQGERILGPIRAMLEQLVFGGVLKTNIVVAALGNDAGIIGAAMLGEDADY